MEIKVYVGNNMSRRAVNVDPFQITVRQLMEQEGLDYERFTFHLGADVVTPAKLDQTFADLGVLEDCYLTSVTKLDSAAN